MKRIAYTILCCSTLLTGCQTADIFSSKLNPANLLPGSKKNVQSQAEIEENSKQFLSEIKEKASNESLQVEQYVQRGQQEIVSWYQDQDDRHISAAKDNFRKALKLQPKGNVDSLHGLAVVADLEKNYQVAEQHYQLALAQAPGDTNILGNLGYSYLLQNRLQESERYLSRASQIDPGNVDAVKHLGEVYAKLGQPGKAQSVLAQVMSPEEARQVVQNQTQLAANSQDQSLVDKLFSRSNSEPQITPQVQQTQTARNVTASRQEMMQFHNSASGYQYPPHNESQLNEQQLKERLALIDREGSQNLNGGPVMINSQTGQLRPDQSRTQRGPQMLANSPSQLPSQQISSTNQNSFSPQNEYSEMSPYQQQQFAQRQQFVQGQQNRQRTQQFNGPGMQHSTARVQQQNDIAQGGGQQSQNSNAQYSQVQPRPNEDPLRRPWGSLSQDGATQVNYEQQQTMQPYPGPQTLNSSQIQGTPIDLSHGSRQSQTSQNQRNNYQHQQYSQQNVQQAAGTNASNRNAYDAASLQAAKLGMGVGPGNMFPAVNETAPNQQPGMQSTWNGGSFGQAQRMLPTDLPPMDLSQANHQQPAVNSMGQQLPGSQVANQYGQFGTASRYDSQMQSNPQQPNQHQQAQLNMQRQQLQMEQQLRDQRMHQQSQLNQQTQDVWNQRPLTPHIPSSGGPRITSPAEYGGMVPVNSSPQQQIQQPQQQEENSVPPYPYSHRSQPDGQSDQPSIQRYQQGRTPQRQGQDSNYYYDANSYQNVVEPPPYRSSMNSNNSQNYNSGIQQIGYSEPVRTRNQYQNQSGSSMPMIVPGTP
jgi:Tfp pilus assembly protein PilF